MTLFGNRDEFAIEIAPFANGIPDGDRSAELTWCAWSCWVNGRNLLAHTRLDNETVQHVANWPAIYLARWVVLAWKGMFETGRWPIEVKARNALHVAKELDRRLVEAMDTDGEEELLDVRDEFIAEHLLGSGMAGGQHPEMALSRDGDVVTIAWNSSNTEECVYHHAAGEAEVDARTFAETIRNFVHWVHAQLPSSEAGVVAEDRRLLGEWLEFTLKPEAAMRFIQHYAGLTGENLTALLTQSKLDFWDFFALTEGAGEQGFSLSPLASPVAMAFRSASPRLGVPDQLRLRKLIFETGSNPAGESTLARARSDLTGPVGPPAPDWELGYRLARRVRRWLDNTDRYVDVETLLQDKLHVAIADVSLNDSLIEGGCMEWERGGPIVFVNTSGTSSFSAWGRRMTLAHELCHLLFDRSDPRPLAHWSGVWSIPRLERRANAFAAEFLMPREGILRVLKSMPEKVAQAGIEQTMVEEFGVGLKTAFWQVSNQLEV